MISSKNDTDIENLRQAGKISKEVLDIALCSCKIGITTLQLDSLINSEIINRKATPWFKEVNNYNYSSCISVNEVWLHGIPSSYTLKRNDVVKIDLGIKYNGMHVDNCYAIVVQEDMTNVNVRDCFAHDDKKVTKFLSDGIRILYSAINEAKVGGRVGDISFAMGHLSNKDGYSVIDGYVGHGIGYKNWEDPQIPCFGVKGAGALIKKNYVFAIELMYTMGAKDFIIGDDGFSVISKDKKTTSMFEHTVLVTENGPEILTL